METRTYNFYYGSNKIVDLKNIKIIYPKKCKKSNKIIDNIILNFSLQDKISKKFHSDGKLLVGAINEKGDLIITET